ncbi:MAG TPA: TIGR02266 family protein [Polyangiaceae bacterium]|jgi:uncharacterized protein (TIGR02266 family)
MNQDTRKDRRVKIVSLNVRYKSATVDEFIENHAHDVSRGGIYIKTANPFPPGTLLKFEIRLASDQAVIAGVGRVVWKRDAGTSNGERPAGMGVKFIKIDEPSKTVIDKLVNTKADAGKAYESENEAPTQVVETPAVRPVVPAVTAKLTPPGAPAVPPVARKATMMGLGIPSLTSDPPPAQAAAPAPSPAPRPAGAGMFPSAQGIDDAAPKQEQTVMKQAAELLEEALREAGGSMEEVGTNPLFSGATPAPGAAKSPSVAPASQRVTSPHVAEVKGPSTSETKKPSTPPVEVKTPALDTALKAREADDAAKARAMVAGMSPAPKRTPSEPPRTTRESPSAKGAAASAEPAAAKKSGGGAFILLFVLVAAAAGGVVLFRDQLFGTGGSPVSTSTGTAATVAPPATTSAPTASAAATESAAASASAPAASASAAPPASASASASASAASTATAAPTATQAAAATARPTATAAATAAPTATATAAHTATAAITATAAPTATATATATAAPKPKPAPKPADDNPY